MGFSDIKPGDFIEVNGHKGQACWVNHLKMLQFGWVIDTLEVCLFIPGRGKYEVFVLSEERRKWDGDYLFSKENIGTEGK